LSKPVKNPDNFYYINLDLNYASLFKMTPVCLKKKAHRMKRRIGEKIGRRQIARWGCPEMVKCIEF
jgi:hypothetical protein